MSAEALELTQERPRVEAGARAQTAQAAAPSAAFPLAALSADR
jgi:hypothetical protein